MTTFVSISRSSPQVVGWNDNIGVRFLLNASRITLKTASLPSTRYRGLPLVVTRRRVSWPINPFNLRDCRVVQSRQVAFVNEKLQEISTKILMKKSASETRKQNKFSGWDSKPQTFWIENRGNSRSVSSYKVQNTWNGNYKAAMLHCSRVRSQRNYFVIYIYIYSFAQNRKLEGEEQNSVHIDLLNKLVNLDLASRVAAVIGGSNFVWPPALWTQFKTANTIVLAIRIF